MNFLIKCSAGALARENRGVQRNTGKMLAGVALSHAKSVL
jgi:hypothetical protein